jgi:CxxC motif-containing protein (DUF1111 family)
MVIFQATLAPPKQRYSNRDGERAREYAGKVIFSQIGCASCHIPSLSLRSLRFDEPGPYNRPGTLAARDAPGIIQVKLASSRNGTNEVHAYTDLKRHNLCDGDIAHLCNERRKQDNVDVNLFLTAKLWDLASSAPYGHRGDLSTVSEAILAHGGEARSTRERFVALADDDKRSLIAFLLTLGREAELHGPVPRNRDARSPRGVSFPVK